MPSPSAHTSSASTAAPSTLPIVAVAVLYKRAIAASESVSSFLRILEAHPVLAAHFKLIVYDNSPLAQELPSQPPLEVQYVHDASNGGLAPAYNYALQSAIAWGAGWLLLLDQDTTLTAAYVEELVARMQLVQDASEIGGIVPKLVSRGTVYSPESNFLLQMREQLRTTRHAVEATATGVQSKPLSAYNSGALLRVDALTAIGRFPKEFWLDYLDHAVFEELTRRGWRLYVMQAALEQNLSHMDVNEVPHWRHRNVLTAQTRYVVRYGNLLERIMYRLYLLRIGRFLWRRCTNRNVWKETLLQAVLLRVPSVRLGG